MRKIIVLTFISLDGVMQAPGAPDEDPSGGFQYGGWIAPYQDEALNSVLKKDMEPADLLLGRKTFEIWENYWPAHEKGWPGVNDVKKYVVSRSKKSSAWQNSVFLDGVDDIRNLKNSEGYDLQVWGSSGLVHSLLANDLVDELRLKIFPVMLGKGKKLFDDTTMPRSLKLVDSKITPGGVIITKYNRDGEVKTGDLTTNS